MNIVRKHNIRAQKKYGQNFLTDEGVLDGIVEAAGVCGEDHVIEVGPGLGSLTKKLAEEAAHVTAIEIDKQMIPVLEEELAGFDGSEGYRRYLSRRNGKGCRKPALLHHDTHSHGTFGERDTF